MPPPSPSAAAVAKFRFKEVGSTMDVAKAIIHACCASGGSAAAPPSSTFAVPPPESWGAYAKANAQAMEALRSASSSPSPFVVIADAQSKGRGTSGRAWKAEGLSASSSSSSSSSSAPPLLTSGNLMMTLCIPSERIPMAVLPVLPLLVGCSARAAIEGFVRSESEKQEEKEGGVGSAVTFVSSNATKTSNHDESPCSSSSTTATALLLGKMALKWPNDLLLGGRKAMGVLIEHEGSYMVLGIGVNVATRPVISTADGSREATCLREYFGWELPPPPSTAQPGDNGGGAVADDSVEQRWLSVAGTIGDLTCQEIMRRVDAHAASGSGSMVGPEAAAARKAVVAEFDRFMDKACVLRRRVDGGAASASASVGGGRGPEVVPISLTEWGHLKVRHVADGREETLAADYLN